LFLEPDCKGIDIRQGQNGPNLGKAKTLRLKRTMTEKTSIVAHLGESAVFLPQLLSRALDANDRVKLRMTVLQDALAHAEQPSGPIRKLQSKGHPPGLDSIALEGTINGARLIDGKTLALPGGKALIEGLCGDIKLMVEPLKAGDAHAATGFSKRVAALDEELSSLADDVVPRSLIGTITSAQRAGGDTAHLLVMDLHRAINSLFARTAVEILAGASVHGLEAFDRPKVEGFMRGLNRTRHLAFGHPGLGTSATRSGDALIIQNDIGATDAHVIIIRVQGLSVTITYTDVHRARARFFTKLIGPEVEWATPEERHVKELTESQFELITGRYEAKTHSALEHFLETLGSRLVFMIDWNKARKALRNFVPDEEAKNILRWAAAQEFGHRGFLELGGAEVIFEAVRRVAGSRVPYGTRLDAALGLEKTSDFLRQALRVASEGLAAARSIRLLKDEIQALLASEFETMERALLTQIVRHLGVSRMLAGMVEDAISAGRLASAENRQNVAKQGRRLEHKGDKLTVESREMASRLSLAPGQARIIVDAVEDAMDSLEDAAFFLSLFPDEQNETFARAFQALVTIAKDGVSHLIRAAEATSCIPDGAQTDVNEALLAIDAVIEAERKADDALRLAMAASVASAPHSTLLPLEFEMTRAVEVSTDHLARAALALRERILTGLKA
jgi:uncharacterized protein Yka (UPF0111/DUF47 family)